MTEGILGGCLIKAKIFRLGFERQVGRQEQKGWGKMNKASVTCETISHISVTGVPEEIREGTKKILEMMVEISPNLIQTINAQIQEA